MIPKDHPLFLLENPSGSWGARPLDAAARSATVAPTAYDHLYDALRGVRGAAQHRMGVLAKVRGSFAFQKEDLRTDRLAEGVRHTLTDFSQWRVANPDRIAAHVDQYTAHLASARARHRLPAVVAARLRDGRGHRVWQAQLMREATHFGVLNMAQVLSPETTEAVVRDVQVRLRNAFPRIDKSRGTAGIVQALEHQLPVLHGLPALGWLADRLENLYRVLPDAVVPAASMGKVVRAMAGVLVIGAIDTLDASRDEAREHFARLLPAAYAYGAAYSIVDDTLHDLPGDQITAKDRERYGQMIIHALATGEPVDPSGLPDHPLVEESYTLHALLLEHYPFQQYRHLYHAAESMYRAQHRDALQTGDALRTAGVASTELSAMYPDLMIKAGMSRVVANILARRELDESFYARCVNTVFVSQLRDDLIDRAEDAQAARLTPFTFPADQADTNPLYDLFAYNAYVSSEVFGGDPVAAEALVSYNAARLASHLSTDRDRAEDLFHRYPVTSEIARFLRVAAGLPPRVVRRMETVDQRLKAGVGQALGHREPTSVDCRTFIADRLAYVNDVVSRYSPPDSGELGEIVAYALAGSGKRLRPALSLMLAEGLGVDPTTIEPMLAAGELFHTASLLFDDLPAQDDATVRRGRPAAHLVFDEGSVQIAAVSMISFGFGLVTQLSRHYPAHKVAEVTAYVGTVLGPERLCRGQQMDLRMGGDTPASSQQILEMYALKTSTAIEASLVPLMMVLDRPPAEVALVERYAHHAGIVFQIRDDILDATSSTEMLGKDANNDTSKANLVRVLGLSEATRLLDAHVAAAESCCARLPFDANLLAGMVRHFATRRR